MTVFSTTGKLYHYKCERCGHEWSKDPFEHNLCYTGKVYYQETCPCPLAKCQGFLIARIIRFFKGERLDSIGRLTKIDEFKVW